MYCNHDNLSLNCAVHFSLQGQFHVTVMTVLVIVTVTVFVAVSVILGEYNCEINCDCDNIPKLESLVVEQVGRYLVSILCL